MDIKRARGILIYIKLKVVSYRRQWTAIENCHYDHLVIHLVG